VTFSETYLKEAIDIMAKFDVSSIESMVDNLASVREQGGRLFILGVGGGAGHASHAVNDFRKIAGFEAYAPTDNVSELTARINDDGWDTVFSNWLQGSRLNAKDAIFVISVGGGNAEKNVSPNLVMALKYAKKIGSTIVGVVGRDGGYTAQVADACLIVPTISADLITPHTESFQALVWHLMVSHPKLKAAPTKWEEFV
jgi:D-sedoheptulose 7-phosphate isomerase